MTTNVIELFWQGLVRVKKNDVNVGVIPDYLFGMSNGEEVFSDAMMEMVKLNNYVLKIGSIDDWRDDGDPTIEEAIEDAADDFDEVDREWLIYSQEQYAVEMDDFVRIASAASSLVVMYFWFIKTLKEICDWAEPSLYREKVKAGSFRQYEMGAILDILDGNTDGQASSKLFAGRIKIIMTKVQEIRNDYAHGNWDKVAKQIQQIRLRNAFEACSEFLTKLENSVVENRNDPEVLSRVIVLEPNKDN